MQKKTMFRKSIWSWALALVLVLQFLAPVEIRAAETTVQVKVENLAVDEAAGAPWTGNLTSLDMDWTEGMTALEALQTYGEAQAIEVLTTDMGFGTMINSIHGLDSSLVPDGASWSSWMYDVNGKQPEVGIDSHVLSAGDVLNFSFTVSYPSIQVNVTNEMVTVEQGAPWVGTIEELPYQGEYFYNIPGSENVTALEVFQIYAENNAIEYEIVDAEFGKYLKTINGLGSDSIIENAKWPGWLFSVNGTFATAGMADTVLEPGDTLDIHFTVTWEEESTTETSETNLLKVGREVDLLQIIATIEQALGQFLQMVRQGELLQRTVLVDDISEDARPQGLYAIWKRGDRDGITLSESITADVLQCRGKLGEFEFSAITKSPLAYRL